MTAHSHGEKEGNFLQTVFDPPNTKAAPFLRSIYYPDGSRYLYFTTFEQFIWLMILLLGAAGLFSSFSHKHAKNLKYPVAHLDRPHRL